MVPGSGTEFGVAGADSKPSGVIGLLLCEVFAVSLIFGEVRSGGSFAVSIGLVCEGAWLLMTGLMLLSVACVPIPEVDIDIDNDIGGGGGTAPLLDTVTLGAGIGPPMKPPSLGRR